MSIINTQRAEAISLVLPDCVRSEIAKQQPLWKERIFKQLPIALSGTDSRAIRFWLGLLSLYNTSEVFTFTIPELENLLQILFDFIVSTKFLSFSTAAVSTFVDIIDSIYEPLSIRFEWRLIYNIIYKFGISRTKIKKRVTPANYISTMLTFAAACRRYFKEDTTEELLIEWKKLIDPQTPFANVATSLTCLFMPVNHNKHHLWFDYILNIWSLFPSVVSNCIFLPMYVRLSAQNLPGFDWSPYIPFFFQKLSLFLGVPVSPIDQDTDSRSNFTAENSDFMFAEPNSINNMTTYFALLFVRLLTPSSSSSSSTTKEVVKEYLTKLIHLLKPLHSPFPQTDNATTVSQAIIFLNALVASYAQRVKADKRKKLELPPLTEDDHMWFLDLILPLYLLELYHAESSCEQLGQLVQLIPSMAIPPVYEAFVRLSEYTHLKEPALRTMAAIAPTIFITGIMESEFLTVVISFVDDISAMDPLKSQWIFTLYEAVMWSKKIDDSLSSWALTLTRKCIEFATTAISDDFADCLGSMELMLSAFNMAVDHHLKETIETMIEESIPLIPVKNISRFVDSIYPSSFGKFCFKEINEKNMNIIKCLVRSSKDFAVKFYPEVENAILEGMKSDKKKVSNEACAVAKWTLRFYASMFPLLPKRQGPSKITSKSIEWHIPTDSDFNVCCQLVDKCTPIMKTHFSEKGDKRSQITGLKIAISLLKGIIAATSPLDFAISEVDPMFTAPTIQMKTSKEISKRLEEISTWLISITSNDLHENVSSLILDAYMVAVTPVDGLAMRAETISEQFDIFCGATKQSVLLPSLEAMFPNHHYWLALKLLSSWTQLVDIPMTDLTSKIIQKVFVYAASPFPTVREGCDGFMAQAALFYGIELAEIMVSMIPIFADCFLLSEDSLSTMSVFMSDFIQVAYAPKQFKLIGDIAINLCRQLPADVPGDNLRALRNDVVRIIDSFDFSMPQLDTEEIYEERRRIIYSSIQRSDIFSSSAETQNYAVALVCSMLMGRKAIIEAEIFEFLASMFLSDDMSVRSVSIQIFGNALELLIPRINIFTDKLESTNSSSELNATESTSELNSCRNCDMKFNQKIEYDHVTSENYDNFLFKDTKIKARKTRCSRVFSREEALDENFMRSFYPESFEERIDSHKMLYSIFIDDLEFVPKICQKFVDSQENNKESFSLEHYQLWTTLFRFFGPPLSLRMIEISTEYLAKEPQVAYLFTASEIIAAVIFSTVYFKYEQIQPIINPLLSFFAEALIGQECDTSFSWFVVLYSVLCDIDPRRFFWFFDFLMDLRPDETQSRSKYLRQDTEICLLLLFSANRDEKKMLEIIRSRFQDYFSNGEEGDRSLVLENSRTAIIQVLLSISRACCRFPFAPEWQNVMNIVFNEYIVKTDAKFIARWVCEQFLNQSYGSIVAAPVCSAKMREFALMDLGENADDDSTTALLHSGINGFLKTNRFIKEVPTKENVQKTLRELIEMCDPSGLPWPKQVLMISFLIEYIKEVFFFISDENVDFVLNEIAIPALEHANLEVQDTASVLISFIFKIFVRMNLDISSFVEKFTQMFNDEDKKLAGAKGLFAVIWSTLIFDDVPQYVLDSFSTISSNRWKDSVLEDAINQFFGDFWNVHNDNYTENVRQLLAPFKSDLMPSYIS